MKRLMLLIFASLLANTLSSQNSRTKVFKSNISHFSFVYPSYLVENKINNAPHMLLKLDSDNYSLAISFWEYNFDKSVTVWDKQIVNNCYNIDKNYPNHYVEHSCEKIYLMINNKKVKCLKSTTRTILIYHNRSTKGKQIIYRLLHNGNYLQFVFFVFEYNNYWDKINFSDKIMEGLIL